MKKKQIPTAIKPELGGGKALMARLFKNKTLIAASLIQQRLCITCMMARTSLDDNFSPFNCFVPFIIQGYDNDFLSYPFYLDIFSISQKRLLHFFLLKEFKITYFRQGYTYITHGSRHHNYDDVIYYTKLYKREV